MCNHNVSKRFSFKFVELIFVQSKLYTSSYFEEKENSEVNAADHQDRDQELEESRESSVPSMRHIGSLMHNLMFPMYQWPDVSLSHQGNMSRQKRI